MAEKIKLSVEADKDAIYVYDATGSFDKKCNPGGWGTPNLEPSDIEETTVEVIPPGAESGTIIDVSAALPNKDGLGFEILASELGLPNIPSGVWRFIYRVKSVVNLFEQQFSISKYFDEAIACCVDDSIGKFDTSNLLSDKNKSITEKEMLLDNARWLACIGNMTAAQTISNHITLQCNCCK